MKNVEIELTPNIRNSKVFIDGEEIKSVYSVTVVGNADESASELVIEGYQRKPNKSGGRPLLVFAANGELAKFKYKLSGGHIKISAQFD